MQIKFFNDLQPFNLSEIESSDLVPRLFLMPRVTLAKKHIKDFAKAHNGYLLYGFMPSDDCDHDIIYFDEEDKRNLYFHIYIPFTVDYINCVYHSDDKFYIVQPESEFFEFMDSGKFSNYNKHTDEFIISYMPFEKSIELTTKRLADDFYLLLKNDDIVGWKLDNSSKYICDFEGDYHTSKSKNIKEVLSQFWQLFKESSFDGMNHKEVDIRQKMQAVSKLAKEEDIYPIFEITSDWIFVNYGDYWHEE